MRSCQSFAPLIFNMPGGPTTTTTCVELEVEELGTTADLYVMQSLRVVLPIGRRRGTHLCRNPSRPRTIMPWGVIVVLENNKNIP